MRVWRFGHEVSAKTFLDPAACANDGLSLLNDPLLGSDDEILLKLKRIDPDSFDTETFATDKRIGQFKIQFRFFSQFVLINALRLRKQTKRFLFARLAEVQNNL